MNNELVNGVKALRGFGNDRKQSGLNTPVSPRRTEAGLQKDLEC